MADPKELPEGTDTVIAGASTTENEEALIVREPTARDKAIDKLKSGTDKFSGQAADKARELVGQGLERGGEALANVSKLVGDTAASLDERLGEEYGEYARRAATALEDAANRISAKDADELIEDTRDFVRKSPGVALAGAAIIGFALVRLVKAGLDQGKTKKARAWRPGVRRSRGEADRRAVRQADRRRQGLCQGGAWSRQGDRGSKGERRQETRATRRRSAAFPHRRSRRALHDPGAGTCAAGRPARRRAHRFARHLRNAAGLGLWAKQEAGKLK